MATSAHKAAPARAAIDSLPDELLLKVFTELAKIGPAYPTEPDSCVTYRFPFRTFDTCVEPHPGLRSYPFLSQVCRRWQNVLCQTGSRQVLWREVVVDFGHELITAVHTPIAWSDQRPSDDEFRSSFSKTRLSAARMLRFIEDRHSCIQRVVLKNSEGYYADDGEFVNLQQKHNFSLAHFGMLLGMLRSTLTELQVRHCADFFTLQALAAIACLPHLKVLRLEELRCRIDQCSLAELANLTQLEELSVTAEDSEHAWLVGMDAVPKQ
ncbi:hypothetical protein WJX73_007392 [Symbiochloris irregularis]|uniref:F-box domain-containing protein n=1 Tax=Symbiochloris irregularis TaxID=706552 RepID=A0AAW1NUV0_9CHLO